MTRALPRLAALAGWHVASVVGPRLATLAGVPQRGVPVLCTGAWLLYPTSEGGARWLYAECAFGWALMDRASTVQRLGPVTLAWHNWQDGSPSVHLLRTSRELTGADREVALARYRRAQETWAEQTMDDLVRATEGA